MLQLTHLEISFVILEHNFLHYQERIVEPLSTISKNKETNFSKLSSSRTPRILLTSKFKGRQIRWIRGNYSENCNGMTQNSIIITKVFSNQKGCLLSHKLPQSDTTIILLWKWTLVDHQPFQMNIPITFQKVLTVFLGNNNSKLDNSAHIPYCWAPIPTIGTTDIRTPVNLALRVNIKTREPTIWNMYRSNMETLTFTKKMDTITQWFHYLHWYKLYKEIYPSFCLMLSIFPINRHESFHS